MAQRPNGERQSGAKREQRRAEVARLSTHGRTVREIADELERQGMTNPSTGRSWGRGTIQGDLDALRSEWRERAIADVTEHRARMLEELRQVKRAAWDQGDLGNVLRAMNQERGLLGVDQNPGTATGNPIEGIHVRFVGSAPESTPEPIATPDDDRPDT